jgi:hypothetical protein
VRSPVEICLGTSPSQAPKSRPFENAAPLPAGMALTVDCNSDSINQEDA